jgi:DHA1 family bicyclomycin/chloramphenicol resistance-like MFS transporter
VFFVSFGICQLVYGPVSDMVGRKPPLYFGLVVFLVGSIGCAFAPDIDALIVFRVIQGIGASSVMVIPRAIIRDLHTGVEAARLMSLVMLVFSVSPILAPLAGSALIVPFGWRAVFVAVSVTTLLSLALTAFSLPETRLPEERVRVGLGSVLGGFGLLLRDARFMGLTFIGGFGMCSFFAFLASSSFVYIGHFGLTPMQYSFAFSINAVGFIGASQLSGMLGARFGLSKVVVAAVAAYTVFACILFAVTALGIDSLPVLVALLFMTFAFLGLVIPSTMVLSLDDHGPIAGMASALGGTLQMVTGGVMIAIVSAFFDGTAKPMVSAIAFCAVTAAVLAFLTLSRARAVQPAQ